MVICTKCGQTNDRGDGFCGRCGAFLEWTGQPAGAPETPPPVTPAAGRSSRRAPPERPAAERAVVATLSAATVKVEPGGLAVLGVEVRNRGRTVDQLTVEVLGAAAAWSSVDPSTLNLLPDMVATATVSFSPPRSSAVRAGAIPFGIGVRSHERPDASVVEHGVVEVAPFVEYETELAPRILRGGQSVATRLKAANSGNVPLSLALDADDPEMALRFRLAPAALRIDPGGSGEVAVQVRSRKTFRSGPPQARPFRVLVTPADGPRRSLEGTFFQTAKPRRRWPFAVGLLALAIAGVAIANPFRGFSWGSLTAGGGAAPSPPTNQPPAEPTLAPAEPTPAPAEPTPAPAQRTPEPAQRTPEPAEPTPTREPTPQPAAWWQEVWDVAAKQGIDLGSPSAEGTTAENLRYQEFTNGAICERPTSMFAISEAIWRKWKSLGGGPGPAADLGYPSGPLLGPDLDQRHQQFDNGAIFWSRDSDVHAVYGRAWDWWMELVRRDGGDVGRVGETGLVGKLGYPTSDVAPNPSGGSAIDLQGGRLGVDQNGTGWTCFWGTADGQRVCLFMVLINP
jgi:hypothetical protein